MKHSNLARAPVFLLPFLLVPFPAPREAGGDPVKVSIKKNAEALPGGQEVDVRVKASCDPIGEVLEAFVQIHQGDFFGDGFFTPICDGVPRSYLVRVIVLEGALEPGEAQASAFVLVCNEDGSICEQGQDSRLIRIRDPRHR